MANELLPLQGEMALVKYLTNLTSSKIANPNYTGATVPAPQLINELTGADLQNLMTDYMRGQGNFLQNMFQSKQSGLYNSNTQKLLAENLLSEAGRRATEANVNIKGQNARLLNEYYSRLANQQPKTIDNTQNQKDALKALGLAGLQNLLRGGFGGGKEGGLLSKLPGFKIGDVGGLLDSISEAFSGGPEVLSPEQVEAAIPAVESYGFDPYEIPQFDFAQLSAPMEVPDFAGYDMPAIEQMLSAEYMPRQGIPEIPDYMNFMFQPTGYDFGSGIGAPIDYSQQFMLSPISPIEPSYDIPTYLNPETPPYYSESGFSGDAYQSGGWSDSPTTYEPYTPEDDSNIGVWGGNGGGGFNISWSW